MGGPPHLTTPTERQAHRTAGANRSRPKPPEGRARLGARLNREHTRFIASVKEDGCYSLDLNPIEMAFAKLKAHLRRISARTIESPFEKGWL